MAELASIADLIMGQSPPSSSYNETGEGLPFFQGKTDFGFRNPEVRLFCSAPRKIAQPNDILMSVRAPVGPTNVANLECCIGRGLAAIRAREIDGRFLYFNLRYIEKLIAGLGSGSTFHAINKSQLGSVDVNPHDFNRDEQRRIADVLSMAELAIEQQQRLITLTAELRTALAHQLLTRGLRQEQTRQTEIGPVPKSWEERPLENAGDVVYGIQAAVAANLQPIGTKILTNKNITLDGKIVLDKINYFVLKTKRHHETVLKRGDLLFNWRSGSKEHVGKTAYFDLPGEFVHSSFILRIRPADDVTGRYLFYYLNFLRESGFFVRKQTFAVNAKFNKSAINQLPTYLPGAEERKQIVSLLDAAGRRLDALHANKRLLDELLRTMLQELMTAHMRVQHVASPALATEATT